MENVTEEVHRDKMALQQIAIKKYSCKRQKCQIAQENNKQRMLQK